MSQTVLEHLLCDNFKFYLKDKELKGVTSVTIFSENSSLLADVTKVFQTKEDSLEDWETIFEPRSILMAENTFHVSTLYWERKEVYLDKV